MSMKWIHQGGIFFLLLMVGTVSGMDPGSGSSSQQTPTLSTLGSQLIKLQEQVEGLHRENIEDKQRIDHLERRVSLLESVCGSSEIETEIPRPLMAIAGGGGNQTYLRSAEILNSSCDFPLPVYRYGHVSVTTPDGKTLVCGGFAPTLPTLSCLQFDYESRSWKNHSTLNTIVATYNYESEDRSYASAVSLSKGTYLLGGGFSTSTSTDFLATGSSVWKQGLEFPGEGVYKSCITKLSDTEFVILGGPRDPKQVWVYNEERDEWTEWPRMEWNINYDVIGDICVALGDIILIAGGHYYPTDITFVYDTKTGLLRRVASLKSKRAGAGMAVYNGKAYIFGGFETYDHGKRRTLSDGEMWNMDTETWEEADINLNYGRSGFALVTMAKEIDCE